jgi:hypothetical protein
MGRPHPTWILKGKISVLELRMMNGMEKRLGTQSLRDQVPNEYLEKNYSRRCLGNTLHIELKGFGDDRECARGDSAYGIGQDDPFVLCHEVLTEDNGSASPGSE